MTKAVFVLCRSSTGLPLQAFASEADARSVARLLRGLEAVSAIYRLPVWPEAGAAVLLDLDAPAEAEAVPPPVKPKCDRHEWWDGVCAKCGERV